MEWSHLDLLNGGKEVVVVADVGENTDLTITMRSQIWMAENLTSSSDNDNKEIDQITNDGIWQGATAGAWCNYDNIAANGAIYGKLYNHMPS